MWLKYFVDSCDDQIIADENFPFLNYSLVVPGIFYFIQFHDTKITEIYESLPLIKRRWSEVTHI